MRKRSPRLIAAVAVLCSLAIPGGWTSSLGPDHAAARSGSATARPSIVGGGPAEVANWQFAIALFRREHGKLRFDCGGSAIAPTKVLTAAHCVYGANAERLAVVVGRPRLTDTSQGESIEVASYAIHPDYTIVRSSHDLAVITLAEPTAQPAVTLATSAESDVATAIRSRLRVAGYGADHPFGNRRPKGLILKKTNQFVLRTQRCTGSFGPRLFKPQLMICARGKRAPRISRSMRRAQFGAFTPIYTSPCRGDSGGPLVADTAAGPRQVGVVSFGGGFCGERFFPAVYQRVAPDLAFINGA
jgi:secreted trypsin-like serine protease